MIPVNNTASFTDYNKCAEEPGLCLNGATCERTWTTARCHCASRFQGDRCDLCSERFHGDDCDQCVERFQGDDCQYCSSRFQGDGCLECADGHYGDNCGKQFLLPLLLFLSIVYYACQRS